MKWFKTKHFEDYQNIIGVAQRPTSERSACKKLIYQRHFARKKAKWKSM